ncbi:zinc finger CCHC domain-containing protein 3-like [Danaus plexippus]|uniref:zinc finger CCHC domain-containing protein 3-like n=1 Tax=Danaus plexippus TaxID=13037 RepID=UPI002AB2A7BF|nr:zinc finger CCHC domain-containing protein 3-like [Danaus plexippus]
MQRGAGKAAPSPASSAPVLVVSEDEFPSLPPPPSKGKGRGKDPKRGKEVAWTAFGPAISSGSVEHAAAGAGAVAAGWTEVVRRKAPKKKEVVPVTKTPAPQPKKKAGPKEGPKKVALPRSQAVMLKLRPEAAAKGASYLSVLLRAEKEVDKKELGIGPLKIRATATGARIIEVPGSTSADKADALAAKLRSVLAEEVEVSRPVKFTDVRVTGLNDATTADRLIAAVAQEGGCTEAQVSVRSVRPGPRGTGSALVEVPAAAARKLLQLGSLSVGWSQVRLSYMEARPKHCFKCLGTGHVAAACPSPKDRSGLCYRCGKEGHKSAQCSASPRCAVCADGSKPADHVMGGHSCRPPSTRGKLPAQPQRAGVSRRASGAEMSE